MNSTVRVRLRPADIADAAQLLAWRNDPATREASFTSDEVTLPEHERWLTGRLDDPSSRLWIAVAGEKQVGQVRLDLRSGGQAEISISVAPEYRARGYAVEMLAAANREASREGLAEEIVARVRPGNRASRALFARAGYRTISESPTEIVLSVRPSPT
jgi:RimJ/RimL family protein N-acetyltransferase